MLAGAAALRTTVESRYWPLAALSGSAWLVLLAFDEALDVPAICSSSGSLLFFASAAVAVIDPNSVATLTLTWLLMVAAMMSPLLHPAVAHVWERTLADRRWRGISLFAAGYVLAWVPILFMSATLSLFLRTALPWEWSPVLFAAGVALVWQGTTIKLDLLNRCHVMRPLPAFGHHGEFARFEFGLTMGGRCVGACWALMALPMAVDAGHFPVMLAAAVVMLNERFEFPRRPHRRPVFLIVGGAMCLAACVRY